MEAHQIQASQALKLALSGEEGLKSWLKQQGFEESEEVKRPQRAVLEKARGFKASDEARAPRLWAHFEPDLTARSLHGAELRKRQKEAVEAHRRLEELDYTAAPHLYLFACPDFLLLFPLEGDAFARRQRFTVEQIEGSSDLAARFLDLSAANMATWEQSEAEEATGNDEDEGGSWDLLDPQLGALKFDFAQHLYGGDRLDESFVAFMGQERRRLVEALLDPGKAEEIFTPVAQELVGTKEAPEPSDLESEPLLRKQLIAAVDTVLLRLVLYRYLEAQHGEMEEAERKQIGLSTFDELLEQTTRVNDEKHEALLKRAREVAKARKPEQLGFSFGEPSTEVLKEKKSTFIEGIKQASAHYQQSAGGDLHRGRLAKAADLLLDRVLSDEKLRDAFATLIEGTRANRYTFNYADLDPRALQRFYEETIGTDIGVDVSDGRVRVVARPRNRKEQGAYFTDERVCRWLATQTLGKRFEELKKRLHEALPPKKRVGPKALAPVRALLDEICDIKVIDPTCGGGIFLRAAFEELSSWRGPITHTLESGLTPKALEALAETPHYQPLLPDADPGRWEWFILLNALHGVDIDVKAINIAANMLTLSALSYRRAGLAFPSFVNVNLKRGNALVSPLSDTERAAFAKRWRKELVEIIELRQKLKAPELSLEDWRQLHSKTQIITETITKAEAESAWSTIFGEIDQDLRWARIEQVGIFIYEIEFPEIFFNQNGELKPNPGFDIVLGNPPWEEPAAEFKHFLPEFDPEYLKLKGHLSEKREQELLEDENIRRRWSSFELSIADYKNILKHSIYRFQNRPINGKIPGAHTNLYKYSIERSHQISKLGGLLGLIVDGGLWGDIASSGIRQLILDQSELKIMLGFINREELFPIDSRQKFGLFILSRGGKTSTFNALFMQTSWDNFNDLIAKSVEIDAELIRNDARDSYPISEVRSKIHFESERSLSSHTSLSKAPWSLETLSEELNAGRHRGYFSNFENGGNLIPLISGKNFNYWGVIHGQAAKLGIDVRDIEGTGGFFVKNRQKNRILKLIADHIGATSAKKKAALKWIESQTGSKSIPEDWIRLDWDDYRLCWRDITNSTNERTLIAGIIPPNCAVTHKAPFVRTLQAYIEGGEVKWARQFEYNKLLYLAGMMSSYAVDAVVRSRLAKTNLSAQFLLGLPIPSWRDSALQKRVAKLTALLTCIPANPEKPWADYTALAQGVGLSTKDALLDPTERLEAEIELNALANQLYGLDGSRFSFLIETLFDTPTHRKTHFSNRDLILDWKPKG